MLSTGPWERLSLKVFILGSNKTLYQSPQQRLWYFAWIRSRGLSLDTLCEGKTHRHSLTLCFPSISPMEVISAATTNSHVLTVHTALPTSVCLSHFQFFFKCLFCGILPASRYMHHTHAWWLRRPERSQIPENWSYRWLWATMYMLGIGPGSSTRAVSALNNWAISLALTMQIIVHFIAYEDYWHSLKLFLTSLLLPKAINPAHMKELHESFRTKPSRPTHCSINLVLYTFNFPEAVLICSPGWPQTAKPAWAFNTRI